MKTRIAAILVLGAIWSAPLSAVPPELAPAMSALDRAYIPALGLSGQSGDLARVRKALLAFEKAWEDFRERFAAHPDFDREWSRDLAGVQEAVEESRAALMDNSNGPAAHEALERVRMILLESRNRQKIPYFLDSLTLFHNFMEDLLAGTPTGNLAEWVGAEKLAFTADLEVCLALWKKVKAREGLLPQAGLPAQAAATYATQWQAINGLLNEIRGALAAGEEAALRAALKQLKPDFVRTFFLFGDFPS